jgi:hypothetical protein
MIDDFYIGYETPVPRQARPLVVGAIGLVLVAAVMLAIILVANQQPFAAASFAFGERTAYTGVIGLDPYPVLDTSDGRLYLVAPGKRGADTLVRPFEGRTVRVEGALIQRGRHRMVEIAANGVVSAPAAAAPATAGAVADLGDATLHGEIVDGKCFLGVMNPGEGTVHRDCARACLLGGLPALFRVRTDDNRLVLFELVTPDGAPMGRTVAPLAGIPVSISGRIQFRHADGTWRLIADRGSIRRR